MADPSAPGPVDPPSLLAVDPPPYTRLRRPVSKVFTARALAGLRPRIRELADELLDRVAGRPRFDLVSSYVKVLPLTMIAEILGVPEPVRDEVQRFADSASVALDPGLSLRQYREVDATEHRAHAVIGAHIARLRPEPGSRSAQPAGHPRRTRSARRPGAAHDCPAGHRGRLPDDGEPDGQRRDDPARPPRPAGRAAGRPERGLPPGRRRYRLSASSACWPSTDVISTDAIWSRGIQVPVS